MSGQFLHSSYYFTFPPPDHSWSAREPENVDDKKPLYEIFVLRVNIVCITMYTADRHPRTKIVVTGDRAVSCTSHVSTTPRDDVTTFSSSFRLPLSTHARRFLFDRIYCTRPCILPVHVKRFPSLLLLCRPSTSVRSRFHIYIARNSSTVHIINRRAIVSVTRLLVPTVLVTIIR